MNFGPGLLVSLALLAALMLVFVLLLRALLAVFRPEPGERARSWKFRTVVHLMLAVVVPLWPLTVPLFVVLAHRSYCAGA